MAAVAPAVVVTSVVLGQAPIATTYPTTGLDPSWRQALSEAPAQGVHFGPDFVFTSGPLASIYTLVPGPTVPWTPFLIGMAYCLVVAYAVWRVIAPKALIGVPVTAFLVTSGLVSRDTLFLAPAFLLPFLILVEVERPSEPRGRPRMRRALASYVIIAASLGVIPLVKFSGAPLVFAGVTVAAAALFLRRHHVSAVLVLGAPAVVLAAVWVVTGQSLGDLPGWLRLGWEMASAYSGAMYAAGPHWQVALYLGCAAALLVVLGVARPPGVHRLDHVALTLMAAVTLFLSFKAGFVRQDGHIFNSASLLLATGFAVACRLGRVAAAASLSVTMLGWFLLAGSISNVPLRTTVADSLTEAWEHGPADLRDQFIHRDLLRARYAEAEAAIQADPNTPRVATSGTVDLYTVALTALFGGDAHWSPRPVIQSYVAYTPELARLNAAHLTSADRPDHLMVGLTAIDNRWPPLDDGASWLPMAQYYDAEPLDPQQFSQLDRRAEPRRITYGPRRTVTGTLNSTIAIHQPHGRWDGMVATVDLPATLAGRARTFLFRPTPVTLVVKTSAGTSISYRYLPQMGGAELVLSPLITSTADLDTLIEQHSAPDQLQDVRSVRFEVAPGDRDWKNTVIISLRPFNIRDPP